MEWTGPRRAADWTIGRAKQGAAADSQKPKHHRAHTFLSGQKVEQNRNRIEGTNGGQGQENPRKKVKGG